MDRRTKVELFEQIRREYAHGDGTIRGIAKKLGMHRRMVREAVLRAVPAERKTPARVKRKLEPAVVFIDAVLEGDNKAPPKLRHTAHRTWCRIGAEMPKVKVAGPWYDARFAHTLAMLEREAFIPQRRACGPCGLNLLPPSCG